MIKYSRHAMWVSDGVVGRTEKILRASSGLGLSQEVSYTGEWDREADSILMLADEADIHNNHGGDPASDTLNMSHAAGFNMVRPRGVSSTMTLNDHVHVCLCGYQPGGGSGDPDLSKHTMTSSEAIVKGTPVYVLSANTVASCNADPGAVVPNYTQTYPVGFANSTTTGSPQDIEVLTEGHIELSDWTAITGSTALLAGAKYFLATTKGRISFAAPTGDGQVAIRVGTALTTTKLDIEINDGVIL